MDCPILGLSWFGRHSLSMISIFASPLFPGTRWFGGTVKGSHQVVELGGKISGLGVFSVCCIDHVPARYKI